MNILSLWTFGALLDWNINKVGCRDLFKNKGHNNFWKPDISHLFYRRLFPILLDGLHDFDNHPTLHSIHLYCKLFCSCTYKQGLEGNLLTKDPQRKSFSLSCQPESSGSKNADLEIRELIQTCIWSIAWRMCCKNEFSHGGISHKIGILYGVNFNS